jgi:hypothetical protein
MCTRNVGTATVAEIETLQFFQDGLERMHEEWTTIIQALHCDLQLSIVLPFQVTPFINPTLRMKCRILCIGAS